jgi:hypothetical protein
MVAVSIFLIVAFITTSAFLTTNAAHRKAQAIKLAMDNLNFAMDSMALKIREGTHYGYGINDGSFSFTSASASGDAIEYFLDNKSLMMKNKGKEIPLTSPEVIIENVEFILAHEGSDTRKRKQRLTIVISGLAGRIPDKPNSGVEFRVQTTVAQRNPS